LIVEKGNDGKPFQLHTEKQDQIDYYNRMNQPWYFAVFMVLLLAIIYWPSVLPTAICGSLAVIFMLPVMIMTIKIRKLKKEKELEE
jgi:Na+/citrate or Na+/malate symporter